VSPASARRFAALVGFLLASSSWVAGQERRVTDDLGTELLIRQPPQRLISLAPSNTELLYALGLGPRIVGVTTYCDYPPEVAAVPRVAGFSDLSVEVIAAAEPDLVVASRGNDVESLRTLQQLGVMVFALDVQTVEQLFGAIARLGRLTYREAAAAALRDSLEQRVGRVAATAAAAPGPRRRVMWGSFVEPIFTAGAGTLIDDVIRLAGGENLGARAKGAWPQISLETIVAWQPEVIITSLMNPEAGADMEAQLERLRQTDGWRAVPAVQSGRVYYVDGARIIDALEQVADHLRERGD